MSKSSRPENDKIQEELRKYSWKTIDAFQDLFPPNYDWGYYIEVIPTEGFDNVCFVWLTDYEDIDPYIDFWNRWNRFITLKAFL